MYYTKQEAGYKDIYLLQYTVWGAINNILLNICKICISAINIMMVYINQGMVQKCIAMYILLTE